MVSINIKMWFDDKFLHDYVSEFLDYSGSHQWRFLTLIILNLKKPIGCHVVTDLMIKKFIQVYADVVCSEDYLLNKIKKGVEYEVFLGIINVKQHLTLL